ncbi:Outer membrane lipoprotein omp16 precursor [Labilithrix luteola]|uniref:Outer membrane lipoprotein omp16 n=1 Tax=Labilithrix luteola TaxID=1391654 RepID=A0A0K1QGY9_9BACT|nr:OmpA family protein [Labilithrix luteola]AKV04700.1 Outer membrane lipoprotein omp16 precursor [Labilithrix luteola]
MKPIVVKLAAYAAITVAASGLVACKPAQPPRELVDARVAYQQATQSPGAYAAQSDMLDAKRSLDRAEQAFKDDPKDQDTRDLAYVAQRKALSAQAKANALYSIEQKRMADQEVAMIQQQNMRAELERAKGALGSQTGELESERRAREAADARTKEALDKIAGIKAEENERGLVLTLSGNVLFAFGKSELLPASRRSLHNVAEVLKNSDRKLRVVGHTDSVGSDETNMALSRKRADSVRNYLVSQGVPSSRIEAEGVGKAVPIADNATPEGRANNRRVEIILEKNSSPRTR